MIKEEISIPLSKTKVLLSFWGSLIFVALGIWFIVHPPNINNSFFNDSTSMLLIGCASILFFGWIGVFTFRKLSDKKPGLILTSDGVVDNSSGVAVGFIPWSDVKTVTVTEVMGQKFVMLVVKNPEEYWSRVSSTIARKTMQMNYQKYGSPISISSNALQINFEELKTLLEESMQKYQ